MVALIIPKWYPNPIHHSLGIFIQQQAEATTPFLTTVVLYPYVCTTLKKGLWTLETEEIRGVQTVYLPYKKHIIGIAFVDKIIKFFLYFWCIYQGYLYAKNKYEKIDVVHASVLLRTGIAALLLKRIAKIPYIVSEHWTGYLSADGNYKGFIRKIISRIVVKNAAQIVTVSQDLAKAMQSHGLKNNYTIVRNIVKNVFLEQNYTSPTQPHILCVAALVDRQKNITGIFNTIVQLKKQYPTIQLECIGSGEDELILKEKIIELQLQDNVTFVGQKTLQYIAQKLGNASCLVLFSNYENLPCVLLEATSVGIPIIATNVGGVCEIILNEKIGKLIPPKDEEALQQAILQYIKNPITHEELVYRKTNAQQYNAKIIGKQLAAIYENTIL